MAINSRLRKVERLASELPEPPCPECGPLIGLIEECAGGYRVFKGFEPCSRCDLQGSVSWEEIADTKESPSPLLKDLHSHRSRPMTRIHISCEEPLPAPSIEDLDPGDVLQGPDGQLYRKGEEASSQEGECG